MLDHLGFIHMNGRIYDATLGRFLSADPTLQFPDNLQNHNRYTYVGNNPLRYTDPSGYFWNPLKTWKKIGSFFKKYWKVIVTVVVAVVVAIAAPYLLGLTGWVAGFVGGAAGGFAGGFTGTMLHGGTLSQAFKAGLEGAAWGAVAGAAGGYIAGAKWAAISAKWLTACKALAYGAVGGTISFAQGGSIEAGFLAGFAGGMAGGYLPTDNAALQVAAGAIVGGCASAIGGGKFESGAVTGAFAALAAYYAGNSTNSDNGLTTTNADEAVAELTIAARAESLTDGHAFVSLELDDGTVTTYGTWGNHPDGPGLYENYKGDSFFGGESHRSMFLTEKGLHRFYDSVAYYKARGWSLGRPCSSFARDSWHTATGEYLNSQTGLISNPLKLKASIDARGSGATWSGSRAAGWLYQSSGDSSLTPLAPVIMRLR